MKTQVIGFVLLFVVATVREASAGGQDGQTAPWFRLESLTGQYFSRPAILGKVTIFVVGRTRASGPETKAWTRVFLKQLHGVAETYAVMVIDKPWFIPRAAVLSEARGFTPPHAHNRVLLEWYEVFADSFGIPKDDIPTLIVLDKHGIVKFRHKGKVNPKGINLVDVMARRLATQS